MDIFELWKNKWAAADLNVLPSNNRQYILDSFHVLNFTPPDELIQLYSILDGMEEMDEEHFRLWSLKEIVEFNQKGSESKNLKRLGAVFSDYLVDSWFYRIREDGSVIYDLGQGEYMVKATSLIEFFTLMSVNPDEALL